jgi:stress response protein SCP2
MSRFELNKGDRFKLLKSGGLTKIQVELGWKGGDLDASTFLLGEDGVILRDSDFVYYNSENRTEPFDRIKFGNKKKWKKETRPMSFDGAVLGSLDDTGVIIDEVDEEDEESNETIDVDLESIEAKIQEIIFVVTIYNREGDSGITFKDVIDPYIKIINAETEDEIVVYKLAENFGSETGVEVGKLICNIDGEWDFEAVGKGYEGGLQTFIDMYA